MSDDLVLNVTDAVANINELALEEQPAAFSKLRDFLEAELDGSNSTSAESR
ncbi:MAG: hypothetical protein RIS82_498 [Actinomycetota bacterium]|jgi:hypothetical protein